uniref:Uncharacterized protein n=1 Tax=Romanomermis culicivorax TaxID=13658 RepID=A0A915HII0_ROMCU
MQSAERNRTKRKFPSRSVRLEVTFDRFPQNCSYPFRPNEYFHAERFKPLTIRSVPAEKTISLTKGREFSNQPRYTYLPLQDADGQMLPLHFLNNNEDPGPIIVSNEANFVDPDTV